MANDWLDDPQDVSHDEAQMLTERHAPVGSQEWWEARWEREEAETRDVVVQGIINNHLYGNPWG